MFSEAEVHAGGVRGESFSWRAHPARQQPGRAAVGLVIIMVLSAMVFWLWVATGGTAALAWFWALGAAFLLLISVQRFYFPSRYTIDDEGITAESAFRTLQRPWCSMRRFVHNDSGGFLSTRARRSSLDALSGIHIVFDGSSSEIARRIRAQMDRIHGVTEEGRSR